MKLATVNSSLVVTSVVAVGVISSILLVVVVSVVVEGVIVLVVSASVKSRSSNKAAAEVVIVGLSTGTGESGTVIFDVFVGNITVGMLLLELAEIEAEAVTVVPCLLPEVVT